MVWGVIGRGCLHAFFTLSIAVVWSFVEVPAAAVEADLHLRPSLEAAVPPVSAACQFGSPKMDFSWIILS